MEVCTTVRVLDQFPFAFYEEHFSIVLASDRKLYIPMVALCKAMVLQTYGQVTRIRDNEAVAESLVTLSRLWVYGDEAREREMICLRLDRLPCWMGTIQPNHIQDEAKRNLIVRYQREFADVAWAAFRHEILPDDMLAELDTTLPPDQHQRSLAAMAITGMSVSATTIRNYLSVTPYSTGWNKALSAVQRQK